MTDITCDYCTERIEGDERFMELQPCRFMYDGSELSRDNMAWRVHMDCLTEFTKRMGAT
jgi:hypothetical protein